MNIEYICNKFLSIKNIEDIKIGVLGAGQLGRMLSQEASALDLDISYLDNNKLTPAGLITHKLSIGDFKDYNDVIEFSKGKDIITIEIENVNVEALKEVEKSGVKVIPSAKIIETIKDKGLQKQFYLSKKLPSSDFRLFNSKEEILAEINKGDLKLPFVQKSREAGYDGKGVMVVSKSNQLDHLMDTPCIIESLVDIEKEVALILARNTDGKINYFDPVEMVFDPEANLLDYLLCPAEITNVQKQELTNISKKLVDALDYIGLLAIEYFITKDGRILINEIAPRTHNSGHHTIDACVNSQFNLQLRSLLNLDLGDTGLKYKFAGIVNLVGDKDSGVGPVKYEGLEKLLSLKAVFPHIYGKFQVKPFRKMGHVNVMADSKEELLNKIDFIKKNIIVRS